jgi:hypothetical protein
MAEKSDIQRVLGQIIGNYERRKRGEYNSIPFHIPKLNRVVPGIVPGLHYLITADTKIGKSKFCRQMFILKPAAWAKAKGYKAKFIYLPLEDSKDRVLKMLICDFLRNTHTIEITVEDLSSMGEHLRLNDIMIEYIKESELYIEEIMNDIIIMDTIRQPKLIYRYLHHILMQHGEIEYETIGEGENQIKKPARYVNKTGTHFVLVVDNVQNIEQEDKHSTPRAAIDEWTEYYVRTWLCNFFGVTVIDIQQQAPASTSHQYANNGQLIVEKVMPSIAGLGDNKATGQTAHVIMGLFSPYRHHIADGSAFGCNVNIMKDFYRHLRVIASNVGEAPVDIGLFFDGLTEDFSQMPEKKDLDKLYSYVRALEDRRGLVGNISDDTFAPFAGLIGS